MRGVITHLGDVALVGVLLVVGTFGTMGAGHISSVDHAVDVRALTLVGLTALTLVVRQRWPVVTLAVATALTATYLLLGYPYGPILFSFAVAVYTVARHLPLRRAATAALPALAIMLLHIFTNDSALPGWLELVPGSAWVIVPFAIGVTVRLAKEATARERADTVRQHAYDERLRVAQEVHDVVGHGLAAIKMQADVALHVLAKKPEQAETALTAISRTSTEALEELRATLAVVRRYDPDGSRSPVPGLARLEELRNRMSEAGVTITLDVTGPVPDLSAAVDLACYRVVQESLTNVLRHSAAKVATVRVGYETGAVLIVVSNPVSPTPAVTGPLPSRGTPIAEGLGIPGMRERVTALGGDFSVGPTPDGNFEVRASIPTAGQPPSNPSRPSRA